MQSYRGKGRVWKLAGQTPQANIYQSTSVPSKYWQKYIGDQLTAITQASGAESKLRYRCAQLSIFCDENLRCQIDIDRSISRLPVLSSHGGRSSVSAPNLSAINKWAALTELGYRQCCQIEIQMFLFTFEWYSWGKFRIFYPICHAWRLILH